ncbi:PTS sugar transporter subunit IIA [Alkalibacter mobilis]|uniref:PTS sugar transporter subunit IIA n=1 Tax=Alkalibacter mobilis TaxID=2787712 RepID=UPI0018A0543C|nr:PTS sugar transporter subunit IIA [Alkalibacter mobilis]MBF7095582.1 PTS sugar transporter subunit IIA [Alkalibacter mobilis]
MDMTKLLTDKRVSFDLKSTTKNDVISELTGILTNDGVISDEGEFIGAVLKREEEFSTGIGMGVAIPHGKNKAVKEPAIAFGRSSAGIDFESMDELPAHLFFIIAVPEKSDDVHLKVLAEISRKLMHQDVRDKLMNVSTYEELIEVFK